MTDLDLLAIEGQRTDKTGGTTTGGLMQQGASRSWGADGSVD
jgi:hypothetical protein